MFLTTEPSLPGRVYTPVRVIFGSGESSTLNTAIGLALAALEREAIPSGADGVIGIHLSISECMGALGTIHHSAAATATAIKFQDR